MKLKKFNNYIYGVVLSSVSLLLFLALVTFSPKDNTLLYYSSAQGGITNLLGVFGANLSAILLYFFGFSSYIFVGSSGAPFPRPLHL